MASYVLNHIRCQKTARRDLCGGGSGNWPSYRDGWHPRGGERGKIHAGWTSRSSAKSEALSLSPLAAAFMTELG